jgi:hypothetical protein
MNGNSQLEQIIEREGSVKLGDNLPYLGGGAYTIYIGGGWFSGSTLAATLPAGTWERDKALLATLRAESFWRAAVGIAVSKYASKGWEIESSVPLRRKRAHDLILNAGAGTQVGEGRFAQLFVQAYLCTKAAVIEIARETKAWSSRVVGLHHLDPLRCLLTNDPEIPVVYWDLQGKWHELRWWQVGVFADMPDVTEANGGAGICAAEGAYPHIRKMAAIERYVTEKVSGERPLAINFVSGVSTRQVDEGMESAKTSALAKGHSTYMGAVIIPVPHPDVSVVTIPLAELPDGFNRKEEFDIALLAYANNLGLDPQDLQPLTGQQLGAGAQSQVLDQKSKGRGLALLQKMYAQWLNEFVLDNATVFSWYEKDLRDEGLEADNLKKRGEWATLLAEKGIITTGQATNVLVDYGDLPTEFLDADVTQTGNVSDDEKPEMTEAAEDDAEDEAEAEDATLADALKEKAPPKVTRRIRGRADKLYLEELDRARRLAKVVRDE